MALIFGLDLGTTSIGSAVIEHDPAAATGVIHHLGVRIFPEARDPDGKPLNQARREKRMLRRQLRRRRIRRRLLNEALARQGLLPAFGTPDWRVLMRSDPVELRVRGLNEPLSPYELGRALYHLAHRRHYREREQEDAPEGADVADEADGAPPAKRRTRQPKAERLDSKEAAERARRVQTVEALRVSGQTLAQHLRKLTEIPSGAPPIPRVRQRGLHALRANVAEEFARLWGAQTPWHPVLGDGDFRAEIEGAIFSQRPVFWRPNTLGQCPLMPGAA
ncbi:MAG: type II CRISPR RNA-guided endonuclease Cas9, partial [Acetobacteraceae bacterium]